MSAFWGGFEKRARQVVYHGSPEMMTLIRPQNKHGDPGVDKAVFATPHKPMAAAYTGKKWGDRDINQSSYMKGGKQTYMLEEMRPGAFKELFHKQRGYLYALPGEKFVSAETLGRKGMSEVVSTMPVKPLRTKEIEDSLKHLKENGVILKPYNPRSGSYRSAVKRMRSRAKDKGPEYLSWIRENNPRLADDIEKRAEYSPPMRVLPKHLQGDQVHEWRARRGVELVHPEPSADELDRIWKNWNEMSRREKIISDHMSRKLFGMTNAEHYQKLKGAKK